MCFDERVLTSIAVSSSTQKSCYSLFGLYFIHSLPSEVWWLNAEERRFYLLEFPPLTTYDVSLEGDVRFAQAQHPNLAGINFLK